MLFRGSSMYFAVVGLTSTTAVLAAVAPYGQCGGGSYSGETACTSGWTCTKYSEWYSQCIAGGSAGTTTAGTTQPSVTSTVVKSSTAPASSTLKTIIASSSATSVKVDATSAVPVASSKQSSAAPSASAGANGANCALDTAFKAHGKKYFGVATDKNRLDAGQNAQIIKANFGQVTPENRYAIPYP